jgi:hypothetical protein
MERLVENLSAQLADLQKENNALRKQAGKTCKRPSQKHVTRGMGSLFKGATGDMGSLWRAISNEVVKQSVDPWAKYEIGKALRCFSWLVPSYVRPSSLLVR